MKNKIKKIPGPIAVFGSGGFIGINLLQTLIKYRTDVIGFSHNPKKSWRIIKAKIPQKFVAKCDLLNSTEIEYVVKQYKPKTIFNLAAYGAYSKQKDTIRIYKTNFLSTVNLLEILKQHKFSVYLHAGSQSEYGLNATKPKENDELIPNSDYAVSKTAVYYLLKYYGKIEGLPVIHLRLYSIYGPYEEPDRLMPTIISSAKKGALPLFVQSDISRDFVYIDDTIEAICTIATRLKKEYYGDAFNIASGKKTTMKELAHLVKKLFKIKQNPKFGSMPNRHWDVTNWVGNPSKVNRVFGWKAKVDLRTGLRRFAAVE